MKLPNLFENNDTIKITAIIFQLKLGDYAVKQQARPVPPHLQEDVGRELEKLIQSGHLEKKHRCRRRLHCFLVRYYSEK